MEGEEGWKKKQYRDLGPTQRAVEHKSRRERDGEVKRERDRRTIPFCCARAGCAWKTRKRRETPTLAQRGRALMLLLRRKEGKKYARRPFALSRGSPITRSSSESVFLALCSSLSSSDLLTTAARSASRTCRLRSTRNRKRRRAESH